MRPTQASGRAGTPVIPAGWSTAPRTVMAGTRTATVTIRRPGGTQGAFDPETGDYETTPYAPHYTGPARVQMLSTQDRATVVAEDDITTVAYQVTVPLTADQIAIGHLVTVSAVDASIGDAAAVGHELLVRSFGDTNTLAWERVLICTRDLG